MSSPHDRLAAHKALLLAKENLLRRQRFEQQQALAERALREQNDRVSELEQAWSRESADVKKLSGLSITALMASVFGSKERRLQKERQELAAAALKLDAGRETAAQLEMERDRLADEVAGLRGAEAAYSAALKGKETLLAGDARLADLAEEEAKNRETARETREAVLAGKSAEAHLARVVDSLRSASNWGTWDLFGGGMISTAIKHSRLDDAKADAIAAQGALQRFRNELTDVGQDLAVKIEIGGFSRFADYFFDGLIMDWCVQSKISSALSSAQNALGRVQTLVYKLREAETDCSMREKELAARRRALIEGA